MSLKKFNEFSKNEKVGVAQPTTKPTTKPTPTKRPGRPSPYRKDRPSVIPRPKASAEDVANKFLNLTKNDKSVKNLLKNKYSKNESVNKRINEGAWGHYPLDNDSASDWKWKFGDMIIKELKDKIKLGIEKPLGENSHNISYVYYSIGMWEIFREKLDTQYTFFTKDEITEMNDLSIDSCDILLEKHMNYINGYSEPKKVINYLKYIKDKLLEKQKKDKNSKYYEK